MAEHKSCEPASSSSPHEALVPAARVYRGEGVEAIHCAVIAVVDRDSRLTHSLGLSDARFFTRSAIKPLQALPLVRTGAADRFGFGSEELALCCASHNGSDEQRAIASGMLQKLGLTPSALRCGTALPLELKLSGKFPLAGEDQDPLRHNCSGKHCGFLALAAALGQDPETYLDPVSPAQLAVKLAVAQACELTPEELTLGVDGCSAPNYAFSVRHLAIGFKNLASASAGRDAGAARIKAAMLGHPLLVSGEKRLDSDFALAFPNRLLCKGARRLRWRWGSASRRSASPSRL